MMVLKIIIYIWHLNLALLSGFNDMVFNTDLTPIYLQFHQKYLPITLKLILSPLTSNNITSYWIATHTINFKDGQHTISVLKNLNSNDKYHSIALQTKYCSPLCWETIYMFMVVLHLWMRLVQTVIEISYYSSFPSTVKALYIKTFYHRSIY
jgi:hypothetical protein